jgi:hypothetical protein
MWCWKRKEGNIWTDGVINAGLLQKVKGGQKCCTKNEKNKCNSIGKILHGNCLLKRIIEWKIEGRIKVTGRQGRRCKQLLEYLKGIGR